MGVPFYQSMVFPVTGDAKNRPVRLEFESILAQLNSNVAATIASGTANRLAYYTSSTAVGALSAITASRALISDANGLPTHSAVTSTTLAFLDATSSVQTQLNGKASTALSNLASVAINTSLVSDTDNTDDLGTSSISWKDLYLDGDVKVGSTTAIDLASSGAVAIRGTNTNDSAASGFVGEYVESNVTTFANTPATGVFGDVTSIQLTAGDWDVTGMVTFQLNGATMQAGAMGIGTASGTSAAGYQNGTTGTDVLPPTADANSSGWIPCIRKSISSTTTFYLKVLAVYSAGQPKAGGTIHARRVR